MAAITGSADLKQKHIQTFGPELGPVYFELYNEIVWLYAKWLEYRKLFAAPPEQITLLNKTASFFFYTIEVVLREDILLHISRLTDHPGKSSSKKLSIRLLPDMVKDKKLRDELHKLLEDALGKCVFAREWRNKQIAHSNYYLAINSEEQANVLPAVSRHQIAEAMESIKKVFNRLSEAFFDNPIGFDLFHTSSGADTLVSFLEEGGKLRKWKMERFRNGRALPEDFQ